MSDDYIKNIDQEFDLDFQVGILSLMSKDVRFLAYASDNLLPSYFSDKDLSWVFSVLRGHFMDTRNVVSERAVKDRLRVDIKRGKIDKERVKYIREVFYGMKNDPISDAGYIQDRVVEFVKRNVMKEAFVKASAAYQQGNYSGVVSIFSEAYKRSDIVLKAGQTYPDVEQYEERVLRRSVVRKVVPTGIMDLDNYLRGGGLGEKELGVILAPTNRGKSMMLKFIAEFNMARGLNGLIFTLEMSEDRYLDRFDMSAAKLTTAEILQNPEKVKEKLIAMADNPAYGSVHIKEYPTQSVTVENLRAYCENLKRGGFFPDFIVVDYADLLRSDTQYSEKRHEHSHIYETLRGWAVEEEIPLWTATQANRASLSKSQVTVADISEDFGKAMIADVIVGLCQNKKEKERQEMRLFIAKNRDGTSGLEVLVRTDFAHGRFYDGP
jgi:replicative DNA helicase